VGTIRHLANAVSEGLKGALPWQRKTQRDKLSLAIAAALEARTGDTAEIAALLPLETERTDMRYQWLSRLVGNPLIKVEEVMEPFARGALEEACAQGQTVLLSIDQTTVRDRHGVLMVSLGYGDRALPLYWCTQGGEGNIGYEAQEGVLDQVRAWLPPVAKVMVLGDRFFGSPDLIRYCQRHGWGYRLRLKGNLLVDTGRVSTTTGELAQGVPPRGLYLTDVLLTGQEVPTNLGLLHEAGHEEAWIIAMDAVPTRARVLDYGTRWPIESLFSDFKTRGFNLEQSHLVYADRLARLILILSLALHWAARSGRDDALKHPLPVEKKAQSTLDDTATVVRRAARSQLSWFKRGLRLLRYLAQRLMPLPHFYECPA
jgi:hypothetical protein